MSQIPVTEAPRSEYRRVVDYRFEVLEHAGYEHDQAAVLAFNGDVDLHQAVELLENGCTPELAARILS